MSSPTFNNITVTSLTTTNDLVVQNDTNVKNFSQNNGTFSVNDPYLKILNSNIIFTSPTHEEEFDHDLKLQQRNIGITNKTTSGTDVQLKRTFTNVVIDNTNDSYNLTNQAKNVVVEHNFETAKTSYSGPNYEYNGENQVQTRNENVSDKYNINRNCGDVVISNNTKTYEVNNESQTYSINHKYNSATLNFYAEQDNVNIGNNTFNGNFKTEEDRTRIVNVGGQFNKTEFAKNDINDLINSGKNHYRTFSAKDVLEEKYTGSNIKIACAAKKGYNLFSIADTSAKEVDSNAVRNRVNYLKEINAKNNNLEKLVFKTNSTQVTKFSEKDFSSYTILEKENGKVKVYKLQEACISKCRFLINKEITDPIIKKKEINKNIM